MLGGADLDLPFWKCSTLVPSPSYLGVIAAKAKNQKHHIIMSLTGSSCGPARVLLPAQSKGKVEASPRAPLCWPALVNQPELHLGLHRVASKNCLCLVALSPSCAHSSARGMLWDSHCGGPREKGFSLS